MNCDKCKDSGFIYDSKTEQTVVCKCVRKRQLEAFLKHYYDARFIKKYATVNLAKDYLFNNVSFENFRNIVKSFLSYALLTTGDFTWRDISGQDLVTVTFGDDEEMLITDLQELDFLIIKIGMDASNKQLGNWLISLINYRKEHSKITWVYVYKDVLPTKLSQIYGAELMDYIKQSHNFKAVSGDKK